MIISNDSPLRRIPSQIDRRQILSFDGIRYSIEMADLAHSRLQEILLEIAQSSSHPEPESFYYPSVILDAWSIVDSVNRLRGLLSQTPGLKQNLPFLVSFMKKTIEVENLRNAVQHLNQQIRKLVDLNLPVWGALSWTIMLDPEFKGVRCCTLIAGTLSDGEHPLVNPLGKNFYPPVDHITLEASQYSVCLSNIMRDVQKLAHSLEETLIEQFRDLPHVGRDVLWGADIVFRKEDLSQ